ncbi:MAG: AMP-binding protein, partial [Planctomycetota bacterium]
ASPLACIVGVDLESSDFPKAVHVAAGEAWQAWTPAPLPRVRSDDPAYIMYSSGSTGRSKGITHTHRSGLAYCRLSTETYDVTSADVIANHSPINFDMSTFGYFVSCYAGAMCVLIPEAHTKFPSSLARLMEQERISIWYSVPLALVQLLLRAPLGDHDLSSLRWVKFGGECFPPKYLKALMQKWPQARFSNVYGPAEVNQCTYFHVPAAYAHEAAHDQVPIGQVWNDSHGLVLDEADQIISDDAVGELVVATPTMMSGYWGREAKDTPVFHWEGRIYYRTGDLVQRRGDGELLFLGRKDRQVKVRGYRVELDDVERAISSHADVEESAVFCVIQGEEKQIWSTVIPKQGGDVEPEGLRRFLQGFISPYAVPTKIDVVEKFPRTSSGKIDRRELQREAQALAQ